MVERVQCPGDEMEPADTSRMSLNDVHWTGEVEIDPLVEMDPLDEMNPSPRKNKDVYYSEDD